MHGSGLAKLPERVLTKSERDKIEWTGGKATAVFLGDVMDKGPQPYSIYVALFELKEQAAAAGGRVVGVV